MSASLNTLLVFLCLCCLTLSCSSGHEQNSPYPDASDSSAAPFPDAGDVTIVGADCIAREVPDGDADEDGVINRNEDSNQNCQLDPGETDPRNPDSDGDGLLDGEEDLNGNGIVDNGEFDPRLSDSDADGTPDNEEPMRLICTPELLDALHIVSFPTLSTSLALPPEMEASTFNEGKIALIYDTSHLSFGFLTQRTAWSSDPQSEFEKTLLLLSEAEMVPTEQSSRLIQTWKSEDLPQRQAVISRLQFDFGEGTPNDAFPSQNPAQLRDRFASVLAEEAVVGEQQSTECKRITLDWVSVLRADQQLISIGMLTCHAALQSDPQLAQRIQDLTSTTAIAPDHFSTSYTCSQESVSPGSGAVDFIWVMDNSPSMSDEFADVERAALAFFSTLDVLELDWRLAVTTTETFQLDSAPETLLHDELLNPCSGLRGDGFIDPSTEDGAAIFHRLVGEDIGCPSPPNEEPLPPNPNLCGNEQESGLKSAIRILTHTGEPGECELTSAHLLRPDAKPYFLWFSDEEDALFLKDGAPLPSDSDERNERLGALTELFTTAGASGCAIVGDRGLSSGGSCPLFEGENAQGSMFGEGYLQLTEALGEPAGSLCDEDFQSPLNACISSAAGLSNRFTPSKTPILSSLKIAVDEQQIPRSEVEGWYYDSETQEVVLKGIDLAEHSQVSMSYLQWQSSTP